MEGQVRQEKRRRIRKSILDVEADVAAAFARLKLVDSYEKRTYTPRHTEICSISIAIQDFRDKGKWFTCPFYSKCERKDKGTYEECR